MAGDGDQVDAAEVAVSLRSVLTAIADGEFEADDTQRAYIAGAADALDSVVERSQGPLD